MKQILFGLIIVILAASCKKEKIESTIDTSQNPELVSISVDGKTSITVVVR